MVKQLRIVAVFAIAASLLTGAMACGRKGPPTLPKQADKAPVEQKQ